MAYIGSRASWELNLYDNIADAMAEAARNNNVKLEGTMGRSLHVDSIADWNFTMQDAMNSYVDLRRAQGRRPFIDGPHFESTYGLGIGFIFGC